MTGTTPITEALISSWLKTRDPFSHKGDYGRASLVAGSVGMIGAALLSARACMRSGAGKMTGNPNHRDHARSRAYQYQTEVHAL